MEEQRLVQFSEVFLIKTLPLVQTFFCDMWDFFENGALWHQRIYDTTLGSRDRGGAGGTAQIFFT